MGSGLDSKDVREYFTRAGTVERWWTPDTGPLSFHYDAEMMVLEDHLPVADSARVLDVGTGRGRFGIRMAERGCHVQAVDLSAEMLEIAREHARQRGVADRFDALECGAEDLHRLEPAQFDLVLCMELFDHLPDLDAALASMRSRLAPEGRLVFTYVPTTSIYGGVGNVYRALSRRFAPENTMISRTYSLGEVRRHLARADFELERFFGVGVLCANAQTRLFVDNPVARGLTRLAIAVARAEARLTPYYTQPVLARLGAHVVGFARPTAS